MLCRHEAEKLGWLPSNSWGCLRCGWVAPITASIPDRRHWWVRHPEAVGLVIGIITVIVGTIAILILIHWAG